MAVIFNFLQVKSVNKSVTGMDIVNLNVIGMNKSILAGMVVNILIL